MSRYGLPQEARQSHRVAREPPACFQAASNSYRQRTPSSSKTARSCIWTVFCQITSHPEISALLKPPAASAATLVSW
jgi:hypothetical protein